MELTAMDTTFRAWVVASLVAGVGFVTLGNTLLATVGVVLIISGLMGLMPVVRNGMTDDERGGTAP